MRDIAIAVSIIAATMAEWPLGVPVHVKNYIRPTSQRLEPNPPEAAWAAFGLKAPNYNAYRIPPVPPLINPALARGPARGAEWEHAGIPQLIWYDPLYGPPASSLPLIPPSIDPPKHNSGERGGYLWDALPMPSSYKYSRADYFDNIWSNTLGAPYPASPP